jgi:hypothetical protein
MRYKKIVEALGPHQVNKLDIEPSDPRYDLYTRSISNYTNLGSKKIADENVELDEESEFQFVRAV